MRRFQRSGCQRVLGLLNAAGPSPSACITGAPASAAPATLLTTNRSVWSVHEAHPDILAETDEMKAQFAREAKENREFYKTTTPFEFRDLKFFVDGDDSEFKDICRDTLDPIFAEYQRSGPLSRKELLEVVRKIGDKKLFHLGQVRSTPRRFLSLVEMIATYNAPVAVIFANHLLATIMSVSFFNPDQIEKMLQGTESMKRIGCVASHGSVSQEEPTPVKATLSPLERCFYLSGSTAMVAPGAAFCDFILVRAYVGTQYTKDLEQLFFVKIRDDKGNLLPNIEVKEPIVDDQIGMATVVFNRIRLDESTIVSDCYLDEKGKLITGEDRTAWVNTFKLQQSLLQLCTLLGVAKRLSYDSVHLSSRKMVMGPTRQADYPFLGMQRTQTSLCPSVGKTLIYSGALNKLLKATTDPQKNPTHEAMALVYGFHHELFEVCMSLSNFQASSFGPANAITGFHLPNHKILGLLVPTSTNQSMLFQAGSVVAQNRLGPHGGIHSLIAKIPTGVLRRTIANPLFSSTSRNLHRHHKFYSHKHAMLMKKMEAYNKVDWTSNDDEDKWQTWHTMRHKDVEHVGMSFLEMFVIDSVMGEMRKTLTPETNTQINAFTLLWSVDRMYNCMNFFIKEYMVSTMYVGTLMMQHDAMTNLVACRLVPLLTTLCISEKVTPYNTTWKEVLGLKPIEEEVKMDKGPRTKEEDDYDPEEDH